MTQKNQTILIVDDQEINRTLLSELLTFYDYDVITASSGEEGLKLIKENSIDCILLDISMPGMNGFEVCSKIKTNPVTSSIPVIFLTALFDSENRDKGYEVGANGYLIKPVSIDVVIDEIKHVTGTFSQEGSHPSNKVSLGVNHA